MPVGVRIAVTARIRVTLPQGLSFTRTTTMVPSSSGTVCKSVLPSDSDVPNIHESDTDRMKAKKIGTDDHNPMTMPSDLSIDGGAQHPQNM